MDDHARRPARLQKCLDAFTESEDIVLAKIIEILGHRSVHDGEHVLIPSSRMCHEKKCLARAQNERTRRLLSCLRSESNEPCGIDGDLDG